MKHLSRLFKWFRWGLGILVLLMLISVSVAFIGIPGAVMNRALEGRTGDWPVWVDRTTFRAGRGWILEDVRLFSPHDQVTPWLVLQEVELQAAWIQGLRGGDWEWSLSYDGGDIQTNLGSWANDLQTDQPVRISGLQGNLALKGEELLLSDISGDLEGIRFELEGTVHPDHFMTPKGDAATKPSPAKKTPSVSLFARLADVVAYLEDFDFAETPVVELTLTPGMGPENPVEITGGLMVDSGARHRGFAFKTLEVGLTYKDRVLNLETLRVAEQDGGKLEVVGDVDFDNELIALQIDNSLQRYALEAISPFALDKLLRSLQVRVEGACNFQLQIPKGPIDELGRTLTMQLDVEKAFYRDTFFPEVSLTLEREGSRLLLGDIKGLVGKGRGKGPISGQVDLRGKGQGIFLDLEGTFYPDQVVSLLGATTERLVREWEFREEAPQFSLTLETWDGARPMEMALDFEASDLVYRGVVFDTLAAKVSVKDQMVKIEDARALRGSHAMQGWVHIPLSLDKIDLDVSSSFPPQDLGQLLGPAARRVIQQVRFDGATWMKAKGHVDLTGKHDHDLSGEVILNDLTLSWVKFAYLSSPFTLKQETLQFPTIESQLVEGTLDGSVTLTKLFSDEAAFDINMKANQADLFKIITAATDTTDTPYSGRLTLDLALKGALKSVPGTPWQRTLNGKGEVAIDEGTLFRIPLLLGLSRILSKVVSGFGYASQTDFTADFDIKDGRLASDNLFLRGTVMSIGGDGHYDIGGKLDVNMRVQLLSRGILSEALKLVLWPIRKLIEIRLTGTLDNPDWQPRNLPKELFGK